MTVEASTDREGKEANTSLDMEEMLKREACPPNDHDEYYESTSRRELTHTCHRATS